MDFQQLKTFCVIVSEKSMTAAAERLKVTQPTVSRQIQLLETELGAQLLERAGSREVQTTVQGQLFFDYAQKILNLAKKAELAVQSLPDHLSGSLSLSTVNYLGMSLVTPVLSSLLKPGNFQIHLSYAAARDIIECMKKSTVDAAILPCLKDEYGVSLPNYDSYTLFQDSIILAGSRKDVSLPKIISVQDIAKKPMASHSDLFPHFKMHLKNTLSAHHIQWNPALEVNNLGALKRIIETGMYWGFVPSLAVQKQIQYGRLSQVKIEGFEYKVNIKVYCLKSAENKKLVELFLFMLKKHISSFSLFEP